MMKYASTFFGVAGGALGILFSLLSAWTKSYNFWYLALALSILSVILSILILKKVKFIGFYILGVAILGWIFLAKIFTVPAVFLIFTGLLELLYDPERE